MNNNVFNFALRLAKLRLMKNVSARDMSVSLGMNPGYISNIENCKAFPSMKMFLEICLYLDITPEEFFLEDVNNHKTIRLISDKLRFLTSDELNAINTLVDGAIKFKT